jgi:hypothetical protein
MSLKRFVVSTLMAAVFSAAAAWPQEPSYQISIRVFEVPPEQSVTSARASGNGVITGTTVGGHVTGKFPGQPVVLPTGLAPDAREEDLKNVLYGLGYLDRSCLPTGVYWAILGTFSISSAEGDFGMESGRKDYHEAAVAASWENQYVSRSEYWLTMAPVAADGDEALLEIAFAGAGRIVLFNRQVSVPIGRTTLIGFRALASRGLVFVIAVSVERPGETDKRPIPMKWY